MNVSKKMVLIVAIVACISSAALCVSLTGENGSVADDTIGYKVTMGDYENGAVTDDRGEKLLPNMTYSDVKTLTAVANDGYQFVSWNDNYPDESREVTGDIEIAPIFEKITAISGETPTQSDNAAENNLDYKIILELALVVLIIIGVYAIYRR